MMRVSSSSVTGLKQSAGAADRNATMGVVELRPLLITRLANMLPGVVPVGFGIEWWFGAGDVLHQVGAVVLAAVGVTLSVRRDQDLRGRLPGPPDGDQRTVCT